MSELSGVLSLGMTICVRNEMDGEGTGNPCTIAIPVDTTGDHDYALDTLAPGSETSDPRDSASRCSELAYLSLSGTWLIDQTMDDIEIDH